MPSIEQTCDTKHNLKAKGNVLSTEDIVLARGEAGPQAHDQGWIDSITQLAINFVAFMQTLVVAAFAGSLDPKYRVGFRSYQPPSAPRPSLFLAWEATERAQVPKYEIMTILENKTEQTIS